MEPVKRAIPQDKGEACMKTVRQVAILDIIEKQDIETQEELAEACGMKYVNGQSTVTYFGAFLYREAEG